VLPSLVESLQVGEVGARQLPRQLSSVARSSDWGCNLQCFAHGCWPFSKTRFVIRGNKDTVSYLTPDAVYLSVDVRHFCLYILLKSAPSVIFCYFIGIAFDASEGTLRLPRRLLSLAGRLPRAADLRTFVCLVPGSSQRRPLLHVSISPLHLHLDTQQTARCSTCDLRQQLSTKPTGILPDSPTSLAAG